MAAISSVAAKDRPAKGTAWTEENWSNPDRPEGMGGYTRSKTLAEKEAWKYQAETPVDEGKEKFEIVTINPVFILGPSVCSGDGTSEGWMKGLLDGSKGRIPRMYMAFVDVRDVA